MGRVDDVVDIDDALARIPVWSGASNVRADRLDGGYCNSTYRVVADDAVYVLRMNGVQYKAFGLDPWEEAKAIEKGHALGMAPRVHYVSPDGNCLVTEWIPGGTLDKGITVHDPEFIKRMGDSLVKLHTITGVNRVCTPYNIVERRIAAIEGCGDRLSDELSVFLPWLDEVRERRSRIPMCAPVFCHNDVLYFNMFHRDGNITLIDWEMCGYGDRYLDLVTMPYICDYTEDEVGLLIESYFGNRAPEHFRLFHEMKLVFTFTFGVWAEMQMAAEPDRSKWLTDYSVYPSWVAGVLREGIR